MALLDHLGISVLDLVQAQEQFDPVLRALGYTPGTAGGNGVYWTQGTETEIILLPIRADAVPVPHRHGETGWQHLAFAMDSRAEVDRLHTVAVAAGWLSVREPALYPRFTDRYYAAFVEDASGIRLEFMHNPPAPPSDS